MSHNKTTQRTLADIIQEKLTEKQTEVHTQFTGKGVNLLLCNFLQDEAWETGSVRRTNNNDPPTL